MGKLLLINAKTAFQQICGINGNLGLKHWNRALQMYRNLQCLGEAWWDLSKWEAEIILLQTGNG